MDYFDIVIGLIVWLVVMLIFREVNCWYWKFTEIVSLLEEINMKLGKSTPVDEMSNPLSNDHQGKRHCPKCVKVFEKSSICPICNIDLVIER